MGDHTYSLTLRVFNLTNIAAAQHDFGFIPLTLTVSIGYVFFPPSPFSIEILTQLTQYIHLNSFSVQLNSISTVPLHAPIFAI